MTEYTTKEKIIDDLSTRLLKLQGEKAMALEYGMDEATRALQSVIILVEDEISLFES